MAMTLKDRVRKLEQRISFVSPSEPGVPNLVIRFVEPGSRDETGRMLIPGGVPCDPHSATCNEKTFHRLLDESVDDFTDRIIRSERKGLQE
jgi:hypothetical protein